MRAMRETRLDSDRRTDGNPSELGEAGLEPARPCGQGILSPMQQNRKLSSKQEVAHPVDSRLPSSLPDSPQNDPELAIFIAALPALPEALRSSIASMVRALNETAKKGR